MAPRAERVRALVERRGVVRNRDVVRALHVSAATAHRLLQALVTSGVLRLEGKGPESRYRLRPVHRRFRLAGLDEDVAWQRVSAEAARVRPLAADEATSLRYAATEMLNNAAEHSGGTRVDV